MGADPTIAWLAPVNTSPIPSAISWNADYGRPGGNEVATGGVTASVTQQRLLDDILAEQRAKSAARMSPEVTAVMTRETAALIASGLASQALKIGDRAPEAFLTNALGAKVALSGLLSKAPTVVNFYRGGW